MLTPFRGRNPQKFKGARIDWDNPIASGLCFYVPFTEGAGYPGELVTGNTGGIASGGAGTLPWTQSPYGNCIRLAGGTLTPAWFGRNNVAGRSNPEIFGSQGLTFFGIASVDGGAGVRRTLLSAQTGNESYLWISQTNNIDAQVFGALVSGPVVNVENTFKSFAFTKDTRPTLSTVKIYIDAQAVASGTVSVSANRSSPPWACQQSGGNRAWNGRIACLAAWRRELSQGEIELLSSNPYILLEQPSYRKYFFIPGSPTVFLEPGSIASAEAFGSPIISASINPDSVASAETFGSPTLTFSILPASISSAEAFGVPVIIPSVIALCLNIEADRIYKLHANLNFKMPHIVITRFYKTPVSVEICVENKDSP